MRWKIREKGNYCYVFNKKGFFETKSKNFFILFQCLMFSLQLITGSWGSFFKENEEQEIVLPYSFFSPVHHGPSYPFMFRVPCTIHMLKAYIYTINPNTLVYSIFLLGSVQEANKAETADNRHWRVSISSHIKGHSL